LISDFAFDHRAIIAEDFQRIVDRDVICDTRSVFYVVWANMFLHGSANVLADVFPVPLKGEGRHDS